MSDNEETPLTQPYHDAITSKQKKSDRINRLHENSGLLDT